jgi:hypothetical protein
MATSQNDFEDKKGAVLSNNDSIEMSPPPRTAHGLVWLLIVTSILMANFLFATDNTIAVNVQPAVIRDFESLDELAWLAVAFLASCWGTNFFW